MREITRLAVAKWRAEKWANDQMSGDEFYASRHGGRPGLSILTQAPADWGPLPAPPPPDSELRPAWELAALARELSMAIASYRALDGLSRRDLADLLGWKSRQVSNLETAERNPSMAALAQLICRLGLKMHIELAPKQGIPYPDIQLKVTKVPPALPPAN
jgi:DNA-binding XRE family transcriptional regulator